ncbi:MAG: NAD/NADP octopine/nopaline dehydrogenase family protein, partial [Deltaproteobacteria bacterium]|nr:NAD/NADP octopine/nopaline dehydrogenase family protein [Deltaproteobacteria bacterium]
VELTGSVTGFGAIEFATTDMGKALEGVSRVIITAPAFAHAAIARQCAPFLREGQLVYLHPGSTLGALEFLVGIRNAGCACDVVVSEMNTLVYACRADEPGRVRIFGVKREVMVGTIPSARTGEAVAAVRACYPQMYAGENALESSLANANAVMHPAPSILNTALIESGKDWCYYTDGFPETIGRFVEGLDAERVAVAEAYGALAYTMLDWYKNAYGVSARTLGEAARANPSYAGIQGQKSLKTRYLLEDIPFGLVPMTELARLKNIPVRHMETVVAMGGLLLGPDALVEGRTLRNLGFSGATADEILKFIVTGR